MLAVIPLKTLNQAKQRLSGHLDNERRQRLMNWMLKRVIKALAGSGYIDRIILVTRECDLQLPQVDTPVELLSLDQDKDLNSALQAAKRVLDNDEKDGKERDSTESILYISGDLPYVLSEDINQFIKKHISEGSDISLSPSSDQKGTNAILLNPNHHFLFEFGEGSFEKHHKQAKKAGMKVSIFSNNDLARDIDTPEQFNALLDTENQLASHLEIQMTDKFEILAEKLSRKEQLDKQEWQQIISIENPEPLMASASKLRDHHFGNIITYSRKVFIPLTHLCRNVCHYCTFAESPKRTEQLFMSLEQILQQVNEAKKLGCKEILFTLGEKPELRYPKAKQFLEESGFASTLEYLAYVAEKTFEETGLLPHINAGCMSEDEIKEFKNFSPSMGLMLENISPRLSEKDMPHYGSPDKDPAPRIETIKAAGKNKVPFTTGILIGIGETRMERIESLLAIEELHQQYGHIQEVIIQNFKAKADTKMKNASEPTLDDFIWTIAIARLILSPEISVQAPPNLSPENLVKLVEAGINDWGGVSPLTPDFVNPEAPWPHLDKLTATTELAGKFLHERLTVYPRYIHPETPWLTEKLYPKVLSLSDCSGLALTESWRTGSDKPLPFSTLNNKQIFTDNTVSPTIRAIVEKAVQGTVLKEHEIVKLFQSRDRDFEFICQQANTLRKKICGDDVTFIINRNINYSNICTYKCAFCAFSKGQARDNLRDRPYKMSIKEIQDRVSEAQQRGASEVCLQGGIHPDYNGEYYLQVCRSIKAVAPDIHIHAFSPLEVWQGASTSNMKLKDFLLELKKAGLASLPGTAAEILDDEIRDIICPDKINTAQWLEVMESAHSLGLKSTATIMFGHVETYQSWAKHLLHIRQLQQKTGGFTEFVPLPFVAEQTPIFKRELSRSGPTFRESVLMHAVARLVLGKLIPNIQASWVKLGEDGVEICLNAGANDLGGSLMNESITRAAGASHGQEMTPDKLEKIIRNVGRSPRVRNTFYEKIASTNNNVFVRQESVEVSQSI